MWFLLHILAAEQETAPGVRLNMLAKYTHRAIELCRLEGIPFAMSRDILN